MKRKIKYKKCKTNVFFFFKLPLKNAKRKKGKRQKGKKDTAKRHNLKKIATLKEFHGNPISMFV